MGMNGRFYGVYEVYEVYPWRGVLVAMEAHYPQGWGRWWEHFESLRSFVGVGEWSVA